MAPGEERVQQAPFLCYKQCCSFRGIWPLVLHLSSGMAGAFLTHYLPGDVPTLGGLCKKIMTHGKLGPRAQV